MGGQSRPSLRNGSFTLTGEPACLMSIGQTVQQLRVESGFSQAQLADRAHITLRALCNVEDGKTTHDRANCQSARLNSDATL
jgi:ribosome-binding protein aMBF1 (putative translation factor)